MSDMIAVTEAKSDQWNADDLRGKEITVTVASVDIKPGTEQPITVRLKGEAKVFRPCKTVARIMKAAWGIDSSVYAGRSMRLFCDPDVTWGGMKVGGIRVRAISHIDAPLVLALQENKKSKKLTTIKPLVAEVQQHPAADKVADGVTALLARIASCTDEDEVRAIIAEPDVMRQRLWLAKNRPPLHYNVEDSIKAALDVFYQDGSDPDPFDAPATSDREKSTGGAE